MRKYFLLSMLLSSTCIVSSQVQVRDEPRHHNVFENEYIRILDVHLGPNDTTLYHLHNTPSVFIMFTNTKVGSQLLGGSPQKGANLKGTLTYDSLAAPRIHRVWNEDTSWFHVMDVELKAKTFKGKLPALNNKNLKPLFNEQSANGYVLTLAPHGKLLIPSSPGGYLLVSLADAVADHLIFDVIQHRIMKAGHFIWIEPGMPSSFSVNEKGGSFALLQLK